MNSDSLGSLLRKRMIVGLLIGAASAILFLSVLVSMHLSDDDAFRQVQLGMSEEEFRKVIAARDILCEYAETRRCRFQDFWREYTIVLSGSPVVVSRKTYFFRRNQLRLLVLGSS